MDMANKGLKRKSAYSAITPAKLAVTSTNASPAIQRASESLLAASVFAHKLTFIYLTNRYVNNAITLALRAKTMPPATHATAPSIGYYLAQADFATANQTIFRIP